MEGTNGQSLHVVFGNGQIGGLLASDLLGRNLRVRVVSRTGGGPPGSERVTSDALDRRAALAATEGATAVYNTMSAPYSAKAWEEVLPALQANVIEAAARRGARLVVLENLYMHGRPTEPLTERTPFAPSSKMGDVRARMALDLLEAHRRGDVEVSVGRASHFVGPGVVQSSVGVRFVEPLSRGATAWFFGDINAPHSVSFTRDVARGLSVLGRWRDDDRAVGRAFNLPVITTTVRELGVRLATAFGTRACVRRAPSLVLRFAGLWVPLLRELWEQQYEWEHPYVVDASLVRSELGLRGSTMTELVGALTASASASASRHEGPVIPHEAS